MQTNKKAWKWLRVNLVWLVAIISLIAAQGITVYHFTNTLRVLEAQMFEDPLEAWSEHSYIVWEYNSTHYGCRNMSTLLVEYLGTSDDIAIQWGIDNSTTKGGTVYVKCPHTLGTYNAAVTLKDKVRLVLENGAAGITVTIDSGATASLEDFHNFDFKRWDSGVLVGFVEDRSQAESASYTIFREGSFYFAKNGTSGSIDYSGTNASQVVNNAVDGLPSSGGKLFFAPQQFEFDSAVQVDITNGNHYVEIEGSNYGYVGAGGTRLKITANTNLLEVP